MTNTWSKPKQTSNRLYIGFTNILTFNIILLQHTGYIFQLSQWWELTPQNTKIFKMGGSLSPTTGNMVTVIQNIKNKKQMGFQKTQCIILSI